MPPLQRKLHILDHSGLHMPCPIATYNPLTRVDASAVPPNELVPEAAGGGSPRHGQPSRGSIHADSGSFSHVHFLCVQSLLWGCNAIEHATEANSTGLQRARQSQGAPLAQCARNAQYNYFGISARKHARNPYFVILGASWLFESGYFDASSALAMWHIWVFTQFYPFDPSSPFFTRFSPDKQQLTMVPPVVVPAGKWAGQHSSQSCALDKARQ